MSRSCPTSQDLPLRQNEAFSPLCLLQHQHQMLVNVIARWFFTASSQNILICWGLLNRYTAEPYSRKASDEKENKDDFLSNCRSAAAETGIRRNFNPLHTITRHYHSITCHYMPFANLNHLLVYIYIVCRTRADYKIISERVIQRNIQVRWTAFTIILGQLSR